MLGHLGINVADLAGARAYYDALMPLLGFEPFLDADDEFAYRPSGAKPGTYLFFYQSAEPSLYSRDQTGLQHLGFMVRPPSAAPEVRGLVPELVPRFGGQVLPEPQVFPQYPQPYFAT